MKDSSVLEMEYFEFVVKSGVTGLQQGLCNVRV